MTPVPPKTWIHRNAETVMAQRQVSRFASTAANGEPPNGTIASNASQQTNQHATVKNNRARNVQSRKAVVRFIIAAKIFKKWRPISAKPHSLVVETSTYARVALTASMAIAADTKTTKPTKMSPLLTPLSVIGKYLL